ncbi:MAG: OsmC family protein [Saprospiraceae bacterium]|nr:OsmC family protein [Saprospiraceae bacterium]
MQSKTQTVEFINHNGDKLSAKIEFPPDQKPRAFAIFVHCFTCNKNLSAVRNISQCLATTGLAVLRFDFTGLGESEGEFVETGFSTNITDILAAASFLSEQFKPPSLIIGHSLGGTAAIFAASSIPSLEAIVTIGSPADPAHVKHLVSDCLREIEEHGETEVSIAGRKFTIGQTFLKDLIQQDIKIILKELKKAILVMHAPFDKIVGIENAKWLYKAAYHPKSFISLDDADHILSQKQHSRYAGTVIAAWATKYIPLESQKNLSSQQKVVVNLEPEDKFTTLIKAGNHYLTADEPMSVGGDDFGPAPYDLLAASLGACTAMTLRMYANRKKWKIGSVQVHLTHDKVYVEDQLASVSDATGSRKVDVIYRIIEFSADLSREQSQRLLEIADRCPVHRTLEGSVLVRTSLSEKE